MGLGRRFLTRSMSALSVRTSMRMPSNSLMRPLVRLAGSPYTVRRRSAVILAWINALCDGVQSFATGMRTTGAFLLEKPHGGKGLLLGAVVLLDHDHLRHAGERRVDRGL